MLFLDEFSSASREVQAAAYKLLLDRMVGQHHLHDRVAMVAAGNRRSDRAIVNPIGTAMASRLVHLEMVVDFTEWLEDVAFAKNYDSRIVAFLSQYPSKLDTFDPDSKEKTFACPRTWEFVNKLINGIQLEDRHVVLLAGTVGPGIAMEFVQFSRVFGEIPVISDVLAYPQSLPVPDTAARRWATVAMLLEHADVQTIPHITTYVGRFSADFRILFYRGLNKKHPELNTVPAVRTALVELSSYIFG